MISTTPVSQSQVRCVVCTGHLNGSDNVDDKINENMWIKFLL